MKDGPGAVSVEVDEDAVVHGALDLVVVHGHGGRRRGRGRVGVGGGRLGALVHLYIGVLCCQGVDCGQDLRGRGDGRGQLLQHGRGGLVVLVRGVGGEGREGGREDGGRVGLWGRLHHGVIVIQVGALWIRGARAQRGR